MEGKCCRKLMEWTNGWKRYVFPFPHQQIYVFVIHLLFIFVLPTHTIFILVLVIISSFVLVVMPFLSSSSLTLFSSLLSSLCINCMSHFSSWSYRSTYYSDGMVRWLVRPTCEWDRNVNLPVIRSFPVQRGSFGSIPSLLGFFPPFLDIFSSVFNLFFSLPSISSSALVMLAGRRQLNFVSQNSWNHGFRWIWRMEGRTRPYTRQHQSRTGG